MPEDEAEDGAFLADLVGGGGSDADGLGVDHFAHDAAGAVGGAHQDGAEVELLGGDFLQAAEEDVRGGVAAGKSDAQPADESAEEGEEPAGASEGETEDGVHAGVACDVAEAEHAGHGDDGKTQANKSATEDLKEFGRSEAEQETGKQSSEETSGAGGGEPIEIELGVFRSGLGDHGWGAENGLVEIRNFPAAGLEGGRCGSTHGVFEGRDAPEEDKNRKNGEGEPGTRDLGSGMVRAGERLLTDFPFVAHGVGEGGLGCGVDGVGFALFRETPDALGLPDAEEEEGGDERDNAGGDIDQIAVHEIGPNELSASERDADNEDGWKDFESFRPADHSADQPEGDDNGSDRKYAANLGAEIAFRENRYGGERVHGDADSTPGDWGSVGDEVESGGVKGLEAEADHESAGDGDGGAESGAAFDERAEAEGHEKELKAAVGRDGGDGLLHDFELAGLDGDVVEEDGGDDNPDDFEETVGRTVGKAGERQLRGHVEDKDGTEKGGCGARDGAEMGADF